MSLPESFEGKFEILHKISEGGMGAVYKVRHVLLDEVRVIKVVRPQHADDENLKARFHREARTATRLRHANIAVMHDFSIGEGGTAYIVMEYIDGRTLHQILRADGPPPLSDTLEIARQALDALSYLHGQGFVHRDISPDNLMLTEGPGREPLVKLIDLGVAKRVGGAHKLTSTGMFLGKVRYSSPEQFSGAELDARSDVYSFGVLLYELLTGRIPIQGEDFSSFIGGHLYRSPVSFDLSDPKGRVPAGLRRVVMKTLEKKPENRVASAAELASLLAPFGQGAARHQTVAIENQRTVVLAEDAPTSLPTGLVSEAMLRIDQLLDAGQFEEAERQLTATIAEVGEVEYLRGLREKLEQARAGGRAEPSEPVASTVPIAEVGGMPEISSTAVTQVTAPGSDRRDDARRDDARPGDTRRDDARPDDAPQRVGGVRLPPWVAAAAVAGVAAIVAWMLIARTGTVAVPIAEETYLKAREQIEAGDAQGVRRWLREVIKADPVENAAHAWATPGEDGPYLPYFYLGLANAMNNDCVAALPALDESERQGEVQKTGHHARLVEERGKCDALFMETVDRSEKRLQQAAEYADLLAAATADEGFAGVWQRSADLRPEIEAALAGYRALQARFEQAQQDGFGAVLRLEPDVADVTGQLEELAARVEEEIDA